MNKKLLVVLTIYVLLIQILLIVSGAVYQWKSIIIILLSLFLVSCTIAYVRKRKYLKLLRHFESKEYSSAINIKVPFIIRGQKMQGYVAYMRAMSFLELGDLQQFIASANTIKRADQQAEKQYLYLLYAIFTNNEKGIKEHLAAYQMCPQTENKSALDKIVRLLEQKGNYAEEDMTFIRTIPFVAIQDLLLKNM